MVHFSPIRFAFYFRFLFSVSYAEDQFFGFTYGCAYFVMSVLGLCLCGVLFPTLAGYGYVCTHEGTVSPISLFTTRWILFSNVMILRFKYVLAGFVLGNVFSHLRGCVWLLSFKGFWIRVFLLTYNSWCKDIYVVWFVLKS